MNRCQKNSKYKALAFGQQAEEIAKSYLEQFLTFVERNYRCRVGEIDLIFQDPQGAIVFVEVKARSSYAFGGAVEALSWEKSRKLVKSGLWYLSERGLSGDTDYRFDLVTVQGKNRQIQWYEQCIQ